MMELQREDLPISVTNVMPATINTPFFNKARTKLGVKPVGMPPIYEPEVVVEAILYAAEHPIRDIFAGGAARIFALGQAVSPRLLDRVLLNIGFAAQHTDEPKSEDAPDNLFGPIEGYNYVRGDFGQQALPASPYTSLQTTSGLKTALGGIALGGLAAVAVRALRNGSHEYSG